MIDRAHAIAARPDVIFCSFGDMLRVPGSRGDLLQLKSQGSDVRIVYSPLDAVNLAAANPDRQGRLLRDRLRDDRARQRDGGLAGAEGGGSRTSACWCRTFWCRRYEAHARGARQPRAGIPGPGPCLPVMGCDEYEPIARAYRVPIVITGFEPLDLLEGILWTRPAARGGPRRGREPLCRAVRPEGNPASRRLIDEVFEVCDRKWRGVGPDPAERLSAARRIPRP